MAVVLIGAAFIPIGTILARQGVLAYEIAVLPGAVVFILALMYGNHLAFQCPHCKAAWGWLALGGNQGFFRIDSRIRYCPYCGQDIDADLEQGPAQKSEEKNAM